MILPRTLKEHLIKMLDKYPVVSVTGPRQSGKTTLLQSAFGNFTYYNLERPDIRELISNDPIGFLKDIGPGVILDEVQNLPEVFSYIQVISDERRMNGQYILSGSQSFLLSQHISQSLAGRVSVNHLFPFDITELDPEITEDPLKTIVKGFYPRLHDQQIEPKDFYPFYLQTYVERDVRSVKAVENLQAFLRFLGLCAGRTGQILHLTSLANDTGISVNTAKSWLSVLQSSFVIFLVQPYFKNFNKRIIKAPKLYFYDTGIASSLLRITQPELLRTHYLYGALFENLVIGEIVKCQAHRGMRPSVYYWRESNGNEIDCIIENENNRTFAIEIKGGKTFSNDYIRSLALFPPGNMPEGINKMVVYAGSGENTVKNIRIVSWENMRSVIKKLF